MFPEFDGLVSRIANQTKKNLDGLRLDTTSWKEQFNEAMNVNGGDVENATFIDYVLHFISFFWKVREILIVMISFPIKCLILVLKLFCLSKIK